MLCTKIPCANIDQAHDFLLMILRASCVVKKDHFVGFDLYGQLFAYELMVTDFKPARIGILCDDTDDCCDWYHQLQQDGANIKSPLRMIDKHTSQEYMSFSISDPFVNIFDVSSYVNNLELRGDFDEIE